MIPFLGFFTRFISKKIIIAVVIATITAAISGFFLYQRSIVNEKDRVIAELMSQINQKNIEMQSLRSKIDTLTVIVKEKERQYTEALKEIETLRNITDESKKRLEEVEKKLMDQERNKRIKDLFESRKYSLILKFTNENIKCWAENFNKTNGRCVAGRWVEKIPEENKK